MEPKISTPSNGNSNYLQRFVVKQDTRIFFVPIQEVDWIQSAANYIRLHVGDRTYMVRETMQHVVASLDPQLFLRIHRNAIVNLASVQEFEVSDSGRMNALLRNGTRVALSRGYQSSVRHLLRNPS